MRPQERREQVLNIIREHERVTVEALAQQTSASEETIRRDLTRLEAIGLIRKYHGGAALPELGARVWNTEPSFQSRSRSQIQQKRAIARRAAALFSPGDSFFIDTGTTTMAFAEELSRLSPITVVTNSAVIAQCIARGGKENRVFLIGGEYRLDAAENVGAFAVEQIGRYRCTHAVLTVGGIGTAGITDYDLQEAEIAHAMLNQAQQLTVLADSSKFGRCGLFAVSSLDNLDRLVADRVPDSSLSAALVAASVETVVSSMPSLANVACASDNGNPLARHRHGSRRAGRDIQLPI